MIDVKALESELAALDKAIEKKQTSRAKSDTAARAAIVELKTERDAVVGKLAAGRKLAAMSPTERAAMADALNEG